VAARVAACEAAREAARVAGAAAATLGVFARLEVTDFCFCFYLFFVFVFLRSHFYSSFLLWVVCCVSDTERQLTPAHDILLWDQVIQADQFFFPALGPLIP
jgi:hypothetical protein